MHNASFAKIVLLLALLTIQFLNCQTTSPENELVNSQHTHDDLDKDAGKSLLKPPDGLREKPQTKTSITAKDPSFHDLQNGVEDDDSIILDAEEDNMIEELESTKRVDNLPRIVNGDDVNLGHLPFLVRILMLRNRGVFVCGGSLLSEHWVLTAAHCVTEELQISGEEHSFVLDGNRILVKAGDVSIERREDSQEEKYATQVYLHPEYHPWYLKADIALLYIEDGFYFTQYTHDNIGPVQIGSSVPDTGTIVTVAGWGVTGDGYLAETLQASSYSVPNQDLCRLHYAKEGYRLHAGMWCTGDWEMTSHSAQGDSGGPVFIKNEGGSFTQYGLVSWGMDIEELGEHDYDVNTNVPFYKTWIEETLESYEEFRKEIHVRESLETATVEMSGMGYFLVNMTCDTGFFIEVEFLTLLHRSDDEMSHVIVRDGLYFDSELLLWRFGVDQPKDLGVTSSSSSLLVIVRTSSSTTKDMTVKFTFQAVQARGENPPPCDDWMALCQDRLQCYDPYYKCDGVTDCLDDSDEEQCPAKSREDKSMGCHKAASSVAIIVGLLVLLH